ncbi:multidrug DMT transporter permease [Rhodovibrio sodomensis]|uniref:Multidrug DMT transporter permease n=1 Tax=Rhodovibrio sodomensis TaxID=1088 RepID=A0ABS1D8T8_9PROT|nr:DMT family transporter [Rhodovibrio sodomensis]MBK1666834.1 multidrug DMT transporter permease [Rhodovibrio sodomensis]
MSARADSDTAAQTGQAPASGGRGTSGHHPGTKGAYLLLAAVILLWGTNWPVMKIGLQSITPFWFAVARMSMGAVTLFGVLAVTGRLSLPRRADMPIVVSVALLQMATFLSLVNLALLTVDAGRSAILAYTTPLWVTPVAVYLLGERLNARKGAGLILGLTGVAVLFNPLGFDWSDPDVVLGNAFLMLAALGWAATILHTRRHTWTSSPLQLAPWQMLAALPVLLILAFVFEGDARIDWSGELIAILLYNGPLATAFCFWAVVTVQRSLPAISTSLGLLGVPTAGVIMSTLVLGEALSLTRVGGLALIVGGMALVNLADLRASRR